MAALSAIRRGLTRQSRREALSATPCRDTGGQSLGRADTSLSRFMHVPDRRVRIWPRGVTR